MNTIEEIKRVIAQKNGFPKWDEAMLSITLNSQNSLINEAIQEYARQMCDVQISRCTNNLDSGYRIGTNNYNTAINSVLSTPNVVTAK